MSSRGILAKQMTEEKKETVLESLNNDIRKLLDDEDRNSEELYCEEPLKKMYYPYLVNKK